MSTPTITIYDAVPTLQDPSQVYSPPSVVGLASLDSTRALGGYRAKNPKPLTPRRLNPRAYQWFRDVSQAEASAGATFYRAFALETDTALSSLTFWLGDVLGLRAATDSFASSGIVVTCGLDPAAGNIGGATIANETTAPAGVVFSAPTIGAPLSLGSLAAGQSRIIWWKLVIPAACIPEQCDAQIFSFSAVPISGSTLTSANVHWWNVLAGVKISSLDYDAVGRGIITTRGTVFSIVTKDAATELVAADPANAPSAPVLFVRIAGTSAAGVTYESLDAARRVGTGTFTYKFQPTQPGSYQITFDCSEDTVTQNIIVTTTPGNADMIPISSISAGGSGGGSGSIIVEANGTIQGTRPAINFNNGTNLTFSAADNSGLNRVDVTGVATTALAVQKAGTLQGTRAKVNFIEGTNTTLTVADNPGQSRVDITVASSAAGAATAIDLDGTLIGTRGTVNFINGSGTTIVSAADNGGASRVDVTFNGVDIVGSGFLPTTISSLVSWYKADSLALSNGDPVSSWADSSGNGHTAVQATGARQPIYNTNVYNSKPAVVFNGSKSMQTNNQNFAEVCVFIVMQGISVSGSKILSNSSGAVNPNDGWDLTATASTGMFQVRKGGSSTLYQLGANGANAMAGTGGGDLPHIMAFRFDGTYFGCMGFIDNLYYKNETANTSNVGTTGVNDILSIGAGNSLVNAMTGTLFEIVCFSGVLTPLQFLHMHQYLAAKYNIPIFY